MNKDYSQPDFLHHVRRFDPSGDYPSRILSLYSATIALADDELQQEVIDLGRRREIDRAAYYEMVLQSYLFLGFPRMLTAAENLDCHWPGDAPAPVLSPVDATETAAWFERGLRLCRQVYGHNYERLKSRVEAMAPDVFRWMIFEGYGKVLSRGVVDPTVRELAIVACLIADNRPKQLLSHMMGTLNIGGTVAQLQILIQDLGAYIGPGYKTAQDCLARVDKK
jgi:alkylhydroperoxidase/carboxymuconolactone decarboxylase family protein YurZ